MPETGMKSCVHASRKKTGAADLEAAVAFWSRKFEALKNDTAAAKRKRGIQEKVVSAGWLLSTEYMRARQIVRPARRPERRLCTTCWVWG
jgi:hypothetical protein